MSRRWSDAAALLGLLCLGHGILLVGELRGLPLRLEHSQNAALFGTNAYALLLGLWYARAFKPWLLALYAGGYGALFYLFFVFNEQWRPMFFIYAVLYAGTFRLPVAQALLWIFVAANTVAQPYGLAAFFAGAAVFLVAYGARKRGAEWFSVACLGAGLLAFVLLLFPLLCFVGSSSVQELLRTYAEEDVRGALRTSLLSASLATVAVFVFGVPLAYGLARTQFRGKGALESAIDVPILIPHSAVGVAFLWLLGEKGVLGNIVRLPGTLTGIVVAQAFVSAPFLIKAALTAFESVEPRLEYTARTLGASSVGAFFRVSLPLAARGIFVGCILTWSRAISELGAVRMIAYHPLTAPVLVFDRGLQAGIEQARPIAVLLVLSCLWVFIGLQVIRSVGFRRFVAEGGR